MSVVASVVLTVLVNVALRAVPGRADRAARRAAGMWPAAGDGDRPPGDHRRVRVYVPWKAMIVASVVLTVVLNLLLRLT